MTPPTQARTDALKAQAQAFVDEIADQLIHLSLTLHANPEVAFEEHQSMALLAGVAEEYGMQVERGVAGLPTAFVATSTGSGPGPTVAVLAEYDALPGLGHACGHNIIGTAATGAALALHTLRDQLPGIFNDVDAAMMVHPGVKAMTTRGSLASNKLKLEFFGRAAHAAASPDLGINALDACIQTFNNINALRQHLTPDVRIHGIITHGGEAPNIVPAYAAAEFSVRAATSDESFAVVEKVVRCAEAGALAAGATVKVQHLGHYANRIANPTLARLFGDNIRSLGENVQEPLPNERMGSSDMGNVSHHLPAIHPYVVIADPGIGGHTPEFAAAAASERGHAALLRSAKAMAMTAIDLLTQPALMQQAQAEFQAEVNFDAPWRKLRFHSESTH